MEYLLLEDGTVIPVPKADTYTEVEALLAEYPGAHHYWCSSSGTVWRLSFISSLGTRVTEMLEGNPPEMIMLACMLE